MLVQQEFTVPGTAARGPAPAGQRIVLKSPPCPADSRIVSGGYFQVGSWDGTLQKIDSYPSFEENLYLVGVNNTSPTAVTLRVYGVCLPT
ncbi:hypothetical protein ACWD4B_24080 [Streptomyces sp. NPDC002536]